jgi:GT2 family glycosyltransferase
MSAPHVDAVVIGRNEGARLIACLASLRGKVGRIIYVDSGSTDDSVAVAQAAGAEVVELDMDRPFTAARARNAGLARLEGGVFVQVVDGDCTVQPGWISDASAYMSTRPGLAVVCGRRREIAPEASVYNRLINREWDTPIGSAKTCGGDAMMRLEALRDVGGYDDSLIAGEEPDLCLRLRAAGWGIWRLGDEMTLHDARMLRFRQWWQRARRAGHAFAEGAARHGAGPERHWIAETRRALLWGAVLPVLIGLAAMVHPLALTLALIYPAQVIRLVRMSDDWQWALFTQVGKFAEAQGALGYYLHRFRGRKQDLIEYK